MDLNELLHAHQVAVMRANASGDEQGRQNHFDKVTLYAKRIRELRKFSSQSALPPKSQAGDTIVYGTYAGDPEPTSRPIDDWESEGGATKPCDPTLPPGMSVTYVPQYRVGKFTYSDLALAMAEHSRQRRSQNTAFA